MRVLVFEHLCSIPSADAALRAEGQAMLTAALADLCACHGVEPVSLVETSLRPLIQAISPGLAVLSVIPGRVEQSFGEAARTCAFALVIAPEFDDLLATRAEWALRPPALSARMT